MLKNMMIKLDTSGGWNAISAVAAAVSIIGFGIYILLS